jgi:hypothetical protein
MRYLLLVIESPLLMSTISGQMFLLFFISILNTNLTGESCQLDVTSGVSAGARTAPRRKRDIASRRLTANRGKLPTPPRYYRTSSLRPWHRGRVPSWLATVYGTAGREAANGARTAEKPVRENISSR